MKYFFRRLLKLCEFNIISKFLSFYEFHLIKINLEKSVFLCIKADINLKLPRPHGKDVYYNTTIKEDCPWKLQQVQVIQKFQKHFPPLNFFFHFHFLLGLDLLMNLPIMNYDDLM